MESGSVGRLIGRLIKAIMAVGVELFRETMTSMKSANTIGMQQRPRAQNWFCNSVLLLNKEKPATIVFCHEIFRVSRRD